MPPPGPTAEGPPYPAPEVMAHYDAVDEAGRLAVAWGPLELERTREIVRRYLAPPPAVVLDVGGAAGVHACWLARQGYQVHLIDPVPRHVKQARQASAAQPEHPLATIRTGDARALPFPDGQADGALLLGPLYHLTEREQRLRALREAARILKPGGVVVGAVISRFASLLDGLARNLFADERFGAIVERDLREGQHRNPTDDPGFFTTAYFHHPEEPQGELAAAGFLHEGTFAVEGPAWLLSDVSGWWDTPDRRGRLLEAVRAIESEPSLLGASAHLLTVGRKESR